MLLNVNGHINQDDLSSAVSAGVPEGTSRVILPSSSRPGFVLNAQRRHI